MRILLAFAVILASLSVVAAIAVRPAEASPTPVGQAQTQKTQTQKTQAQRKVAAKKRAQARRKKLLRCLALEAKRKRGKHPNRRKLKKCTTLRLHPRVLRTPAAGGGNPGSGAGSPAGGSSPVATAQAPVASFTYSPASPLVGHAISLDATGSSCPGAPCTFEWSNDDGPKQPIPPQTPLGSGEHISLTFQVPGIEYVRLLITNVLGQTATVEHNITVTAPSSTPTAPPPSPPPPKSGCITTPSSCGYPDATTTGVPAGTQLTAQSSHISVSSPGTTIKDLALDADISVEANNTTIEDSEITVDGTQTCGESCGGRGIWIKPGVTGTLIKNVTCHGGAPSGQNVTQYCIMSNDSATTVEHLHAYYCTECLAGAMNVSNSFIDETGASIPGEHYEDIYYGGGAGPLIVNHNTMLNPNGQTAIVFASVDFGDQTTLTITNNLMAGGGYMIYGGGSGSAGKVLGPVTITGNRFSRKYYPGGGYYGVASYVENSVTTWSGNIWDDTLKSIPMP